MRGDYNRRVGRQVDDFRTFVNTHYMVERDDTPFWREVRTNRIHPETKERLARWSKEMPRHGSLPAISVRAAAHRDAACTIQCCRGSACWTRRSPRPRWHAIRKLRSFAKATYDSMVREYKQAATQALGHAEFLPQAIRDGASLPWRADGTDDRRGEADQRDRGDARQDRRARAAQRGEAAAQREPGEAAGDYAERECAGIGPELRMVMREHRHRKDQALGIDAGREIDEARADDDLLRIECDTLAP